jgi:hypothetical protein
VAATGLALRRRKPAEPSVGRVVSCRDRVNPSLRGRPLSRMYARRKGIQASEERVDERHESMSDAAHKALSIRQFAQPHGGRRRRVVLDRRPGPISTSRGLSCSLRDSHADDQVACA